MSERRQIILDTETTGLEPSEGHRIIEIGAVELVNRRLTGNNFWQYLQPDRLIDEGAIEVHGITNEFLEDKPRMADVVESFIDYVRGAELIIHNAPFDVGFLNHELALLGGNWGRIEDYCSITDTLVMARKMRPGQRNTLDALCKVYEVDNSGRQVHGALLDAQLLAEVYLAMTGGQRRLMLDDEAPEVAATHELTVQKVARSGALRVIDATADECRAHEAMLEMLSEAAGRPVAW